MINIFDVVELHDDTYQCECHKCTNKAVYRLYILGIPSLYICAKCLTNTINNLSKHK